MAASPEQTCTTCQHTSDFGGGSRRLRVAEHWLAAVMETSAGGVELDEISFDKRDGVAEIILDRPEQLNPISARPGGTRDQILWALANAEADPEVGCVLLSGAGRAFS